MSVALVAIVRDEADKVHRMISSVCGLVDSAFIVDTGSKDGTPEALTEAARKNNIELHLTHHKWINYGLNRTHALSLARDKADWIFELDADQVAVWHVDLPGWLESKEADADGYTISEQEDGKVWFRPRLLRGNLDWKYIGPTHEYLEVKNRVINTMYRESLQIIHHADGANRADKYRRDVRMLAPGVKQKDPRAIFYTAESYRMLGEYKKAMKFYDQRASMSGYEEEAWYAEYQAGRTCLEYVDTEEGMQRLLKAHMRRPTRAEPLATIMHWCSNNLPSAIPHQDTLFIEEPAYRINRSA